MRESLDERAADRQMDADLARWRDERDHGDDRNDKRCDVDPVRAGDTEGEDHDAGESGTRDRRGLKEDLVQCHRGWELLALDEAWRKRTARRAIES